MLLDSHLEQITTSAKAIGDLEFPPPKIFTNALLGQHEITTLIRDTEPHERSLFTVDPNVSKTSTTTSSRKSFAPHADGSNRRKTISAVQQRQGSAVAKVLGNEMLRQIQQSSHGNKRSRGIDIEVLLQGAVRLLAVYPVADARERISRLRSHHGRLVESIAYYEGLLLQQKSRSDRFDDIHDLDEELEDDANTVAGTDTVPGATGYDLRTEEEEVHELEARKKVLEERIAGMVKDLGGLLE